MIKKLLGLDPCIMWLIMNKKQGGYRSNIMDMMIILDLDPVVLWLNKSWNSNRSKNEKVDKFGSISWFFSSSYSCEYCLIRGMLKFVIFIRVEYRSLDSSSFSPSDSKYIHLKSGLYGTPVKVYLFIEYSFHSLAHVFGYFTIYSGLQISVNETIFTIFLH